MNKFKDSDIARQFIELGYRGVNHAITREDFQERKHRTERILQSHHHHYQDPITIISNSLTITEPFAKELASREEANRTDNLLTIIFLRDRNHHGHEISAYIDYANRLKFENFTEFFLGKTKLLPLTTDLSYYNWDTHMCISNDTTNFCLLPDVNGIRFRCQHDRKIIYVDPESKYYGDGTIRTIINTKDYLQIILYVNLIFEQKKRFSCVRFDSFRIIIYVEKNFHDWMIKYFLFCYYVSGLNNRLIHTVIIQRTHRHIHIHIENKQKKEEYNRQIQLLRHTCIFNKTKKNKDQVLF